MPWPRRRGGCAPGWGAEGAASDDGRHPARPLRQQRRQGAQPLLQRCPVRRRAEGDAQPAPALAEGAARHQRQPSFMLLTCIPPLRPLKGWRVASQYFYKAEEARFGQRRAPNAG
ncbi:hypothetical protein CR165_07440 [Pseudoroseomonas aestuarii]|uniref:Uncharacterized protein n=1 Tax=Teichococcus aestuarii TaxID=568898 RepID=A0A2U1V791_9PROT|nr:hypothetical protein CR165_07440 [Pseudoroseomonas aestuarii]